MAKLQTAKLQFKMSWEPQVFTESFAPTLTHYYASDIILIENYLNMKSMKSSCLHRSILWCGTFRSRLSMKVTFSIPLIISFFVLFQVKTTTLGTRTHAGYVLYVHATSASDLKSSDKEGIKSPEFPVYSVPKPGLVVVSGKSNFRYIGVR